MKTISDNKPWLTVVAMCLVPSVAQANGWNSIEMCINATFGGAAIGCVVGLIASLLRRAGTGRLFGWTIGGGVALGIGSLLVASIISMPGNPDFIGFALVAVVGALAIAGFGGAALAAVAILLRNLRRGKPDSNKTPE